MKCVIIFSVIPKNQGLHKSSAHISSNNSKSTNHISLTGTDNCYCKISRNTTLEENLQENQRVNYISGIAQAFKSKVLIIYAATYIADCTVSNQLQQQFFVYLVQLFPYLPPIFFSQYFFFFFLTLSYFSLRETHSKIYFV